jgi:aminoglycoside 6'-N-acetyltransferase
VILRGERLVLRSVAPADAPRLVEIAAKPEVGRWWRDVTADDMQELVDGEDGVVGLAVELVGELIGMIQYREEPDPDYRHAGIDLFLTTSQHAKGLGREAVPLHLVDDLGHYRITIDPPAANERAIRAYGAVGFRPLGVMHRTSAASTASFTTGC